MKSADRISRRECAIVDDVALAHAGAAERRARANSHLAGACTAAGSVCQKERPGANRRAARVRIASRASKRKDVCTGLGQTSTAAENAAERRRVIIAAGYEAGGKRDVSAG